MEALSPVPERAATAVIPGVGLGRYAVGGGGRALETERRSAVPDPFARALAGDAGVEMLYTMRGVAGHVRASPDPIRT
jgi:hypothetical protein